MKTETQHDPIARLWSVARDAVARMTAVIGDASAIAAMIRIDGGALREMRAWIGSLVAFARKLVLIEAASLAREPDQRLTRPGAAAPQPTHARKRQQSRRASLRLWPRSAPPPARIRSLGPPVTVAEIWRDRARLALCRRLALARASMASEPVRLARRIEALTRLIAHPCAAVRRLARKLRRGPRLAITLAAKRPPRRNRVDVDASDDACRRAYAAALTFCDSS